MKRNPGAVALAALTVAVSSVLTFAGLLVGGFKCDDHCSTIGRWSHDIDAWQWTAMTALSIGVFLLALALLLVALKGLKNPAWAVLCIWILATVWLLSLLDGSGYF